MDRGAVIDALEVILDRTSDLDDAACRGAGDLFDPRDHEGDEAAEDHHYRQAAALAICAACPVLDACREWALTVPHHGQVLAGVVHTRTNARKDTAA